MAVFKSINISLHGPVYMNDLFTSSVTLTGFSGRNQHRFYISGIRTSYGRSSFYYRGAVLWNQLNPRLYGTYDLFNFKSLYKQLLVSLLCVCFCVVYLVSCLFFCCSSYMFVFVFIFRALLKSSLLSIKAMIFIPVGTLPDDHMTGHVMVSSLHSGLRSSCF